MGTQFLVLRQSMAVYYGNELILGLVLGIWLMWTTLGSWIGHILLRKQKVGETAFLIALSTALIFSFLILIALFFIRKILDVPYGEYITVVQVALFSLMITVIPCLLCGFSFSYVSKSIQDLRKEGEPAARAYAYEALGTVITGLLFSQLARWVTNLYIDLILVTVISFILFLTSRRRWILFLLLIALIPASPWIFSPLHQSLQRIYWTSMAAEMELRESRTTPFGQVAVVNWGGESNLYQNGIKYSALSEPIDNQSLAAMLVAQHGDPQNMLLVEGNVGGLALECSKFAAVSAIEMDEAMFDFALSNMESNIRQQWATSDITLIHKDARYFLNHTQSKWDVIAINAGKPMSAVTNRYYTENFFKQVKRRLNKDGILVICNFPSGENFLGPQLLSLNAILWNTLNHVFEEVVVIPGDAALFLAGDSGSPLSTSADTLMLRYRQHHIELEHFIPELFIYRLEPQRMKQISDLLESSVETRLNRDYKPISYLFDFLIWHKIVRGDSKGLVTLTSFPFWGVVLLGLILLFTAGLVRLSSVKPMVTAATMTLGFTAMAFHVLLLCGFQMIFGYLYTWIGIAVAGFMGGMAASSLLVNRILDKLKLFQSLLLVFGLFIFTLIAMLPIFSIIDRWHLDVVYFLLTVFTGALVGAAFPLLTRLASTVYRYSDIAGVYAADILGGALGALILSGFLIPLYGFRNTIAVIILLCLVAIVCFVRIFRMIQ